MIIREANVSDISSIYDIAVENQLHQGTHIQNGFLVSAYDVETYTRYLKEGNTILVVEKNHKVVAFLLTFLSEKLDDSVLANKLMLSHATRPFAVIKQVCVKKGFQRQGFGKALYEHFTDHVFRDVYLAVVTQPYNEASIAFHDKLGFKKTFHFKGDDSLERIVYVKPYYENMENYSAHVLIPQYEQAVALYMHEDNLNWSKLNHLFYITAGLFGVFTYAINSPLNPHMLAMFLFFVSLLGIVSSFLFYSTVKSGVDYLSRRKDAVIAIEKKLDILGGTLIVGKDLYKNSLLKRSLTSKIMQDLPLFIMMIWLVIMVSIIALTLGISFL